MDYAQLKAALISLQSAIKTANGDALPAALASVEKFAVEHSETLHPQLAHFLERRSYAKALAWLEGEASSIPPGGCTR